MNDGKDRQEHTHLAPPEQVIADALRPAASPGCGTTGLRNRRPERQGEIAIQALRFAGYTIMRPVCEACEGFDVN